MSDILTPKQIEKLQPSGEAHWDWIDAFAALQKSHEALRAQLKQVTRERDQWRELAKDAPFALHPPALWTAQNEWHRRLAALEAAEKEAK